MLTQAPRGTKDVLPADSYRWQYVESKMRQAAAEAGFREVRTPVFEHTELFLRGVGDTRRPLIFLFFAGIVNVGLNLLLVIQFNLSVAGVGIATVVSQYISAALVLWCMLKTDGCYHIVLKELRIHRDKLIRILKIGIPAGLQGAIFSISNVLIQSSINSFGSTAMAGNAAAVNIEGFVFTSCNSVAQASLTLSLIHI